LPRHGGVKYNYISSHVVYCHSVKRLEDLKDNPELGKPLTGRLAGLWSLRTGDYRALYQIRHGELLILVLRIKHRKDAYDF